MAEEPQNSLLSSHYKLGQNQGEVERMRNQHEWIKGSFGGLIKAPIDLYKPHQKILDSATADGTWICDIASLFPPETELIGFEVAPQMFRRPEDLPPNVALVPGDITKALPQEWNHNFDLVHQRFLCPAFAPDTVREMIGRLMECVKPGGWIQLVEPAANENVSASPSSIGWPPSGFVNINVKTKALVVGVFQHNKELDARGRKNFRTIVNNFMQVVDPKTLGVSEENKHTVLDRFNADLEKYRTALRHNIIWAQRPE
ncbi:hypothetical protein N658DRAFT_508562 [Parathielavia hyrcaniae]|uniref:Methyltransferase domain-containing protein n=1 Tax=Parathielavia hyrcaniae TaxID=113614 RepID=A0AAN6PXC2_9PEZI|nr:hypothetical protein N658DRAFT_508562 [Parathielavia hyrcaniae]